MPDPVEDLRDIKAYKETLSHAFQEFKPALSEVNTSWMSVTESVLYFTEWTGNSQDI